MQRSSVGTQRDTRGHEVRGDTIGRHVEDTGDTKGHREKTRWDKGTGGDVEGTLWRTEGT